MVLLFKFHRQKANKYILPYGLWMKYSVISPFVLYVAYYELLTIMAVEYLSVHTPVLLCSTFKQNIAYLEYRLICGLP